MQQPMNQPEPIGGQHQQAMSQQMVLCPVRFVYETQVLVQPGDQIQPNQTFFINPQNPPPWMQNRAPAPNPVVYVQQVPNNMVSSVQQHMDQNQLYLQQNFANFQLQQHMLSQNHQEMRPTMQLANIVPNMVQNVQQNINERNINQNSNAGQIQANSQNLIQNQMNVANTRQVPNQVNQTVEVQRQVFMNVRPQMNQQVNLSRPVMSVNQFQNMALANMQNVQLHQGNIGQTFIQNIGQRAPPQNVNAVRPQTTNNTMNIQPVAKVREGTPSEANKSNTAVGTSVPNVKNFTQNYNCRPIQPRRRYVQSNAATPKTQTQQFPAQTAQPTPAQSVQHIPIQNMQHIPIQNVQHIPVQNVQHVPVQNVQHIPVQNVQHIPVQNLQHIPVQSAPTQYNNEKSNSHQIVTNIAANTTHLNNPNINRKRKSESPDEIQNKMAMHSNAKPNYNSNLQQGIIVTKLCNEIGTNTSPVHKPNTNTKTASLQINPNTQKIMIENVQQTNENLIKNMTEPKNITITPLPSEKDKLIRNTVYTQARGRLLQDKISDNLFPQVTENKAPENIQNTTGNKVNTPVPMEVQNEKTNILTEMQTTQHRIVIEIQSETNESKKVEALEIKNIVAPKIKNIEAPKTKNIEASEIIKIEAPEIIKIEAPEIQKIETPENKPEITDKNTTTTTGIEAKVNTEVKVEAQSEVNGQTSEGNDVKQVSDSKQDILTHVVDGYVIQESNFAFPIRKPLKEKILYTNSKTEESDATDALKECMKEEMKNTGVDIPLLPFHYLLLNCEKKKEGDTKIDEHQSEESNPFAELQHTTVKSWTVEDLSSHLLKFNWNETVSVFQDHEIDGESLFLVSKPQLMTIGVTEEHADAICEFVRS